MDTLVSQRTAAAASVDPSPSLWLVVMALLCLLVLLLPLEGDSPTWPSYLHITVNQKLIAAFALGRYTTVALSPAPPFSGEPGDEASTSLCKLYSPPI